ncbi:MAG: hypothetical protein UX68_C0006G0040 [Parcubacteria group bacterium GW2011_GWA2_46_9]|nr:MAG: hypothetical protein UX68_C0006G0040 [Parcubacteria group bacterium GW2011_GWA2_46_9]
MPKVKQTNDVDSPPQGMIESPVKNGDTHPSSCTWPHWIRIGLNETPEEVMRDWGAF